MNSIYTDHNLSAMAPLCAEGEEANEVQPGGFLYQAATVLAILLFLISF